MISRLRKMGIFITISIIIISVFLWGDMLWEIAALHIHKHKGKREEKLYMKTDSSNETVFGTLLVLSAQLKKKNIAFHHYEQKR